MEVLFYSWLIGNLVLIFLVTVYFYYESLIEISDNYSCSVKIITFIISIILTISSIVLLPSMLINHSLYYYLFKKRKMWK